ncbi:MAG: hypothetical protein K1000chlam1_00562 [Candidatus Anoxychlamydiales bacterium]|nr:hypothetical protein [Candidatus Anoxychlamydiales bacterium]
MIIKSYQSSLISFPITRNFWNYSSKPCYQLAKVPIIPLVALFDSTIGRFINIINTYQHNQLTRDYKDFKISLNNNKNDCKTRLKQIAFTVVILAISLLFNGTLLIGIKIAALYATIESSFVIFNALKLLINNPIKGILKELEIIQPEQISTTLKKDILNGFKGMLIRKREEKVIGSILYAPIIEELIFRGAIQSLIKNTIIYFLPIYIKIAAKIAIIICGILFGLAHFKQSKWQALHAGINGCFVYGPLMEKYGLLTSIAAHITNNILMVGTIVSIDYYHDRSLDKCSSKLFQNKNQK